MFNRLLGAVLALFAVGLPIQTDAQFNGCDAGFCQFPPGFICPGTPIHLTAPDDFTNAAWTPTNLTLHANTQTDPLGGSTAGDMTGTGAGSLSEVIIQNVTMSTNTTYSISGYLKSVVAPPWALVGFQDTGFVNAFTNYFNFSTGAVGSVLVTGGGAISCAKLQAAGNGFYWFSLAGSTSAISGSQVFRIWMVTLGDGSNNNSVLGQEYYYYNVGP